MKAPSRRRLDQLLVERGLAESRAKAQALILAGEVFVDGQKAAKPGHTVALESRVELAGRLPFVSRGGLKLAAALEGFAIQVEGRVCLDVGASTGGFTDCLLQRGAAHVHAIDVGRGQLAAKLALDPRVVVHDRVNARALEPALLADLAGAAPDVADLAVIDVSFISLALILGPVAACLAPSADVVALVKPQFEAGRASVRGGVVRDPAVHRSVLAAAVAQARAADLTPLGLCASPLLGPAGNREFFLHAARGVAGEATARIPPAGDLEARIAVLAPG